MIYSERIRTFEKRNRRILRLRGKGWSIRRLADHFGISATRIQQIIERAQR